MMDENKFSQQAPWAIPSNAQFSEDHRVGYRQISFHWEDAGWQYNARWHQQLPTATLITYPSWQLSRVLPGKGFGPAAHQRREEVLVGDQWLPMRQIRYCALRLAKGVATSQELMVLKRAHVRASF